MLCSPFQQSRRSSMSVDSTVSRRALLVLIASFLMLTFGCSSFLLAAHAQRTLKFPFIHQTKVGDIDAYNTVNLWAGLRSAMKYVNDNQLIQSGSIVLDIPFVEGAESKTVNSSIATALVVRIMSQGTVYGFINPDYYSSGVLTATALGEAYPVLNALTTTVATYTSAYPNWLHLRPSTFDEAQLVTQHAVHSDAMCTTIVVFWVALPGIADILSSLQSSIAAMGLAAARSLNVGANFTVVTELWFSDPNRIPDCAIIAGGSGTVQGIFEVLYADPRFDRENTFIYSSSAGQLPKFVSATFGVAPFANGRMVQVVNDPEDRTIKSSALYQDALAAWIASNETLPANMVAANQNVTTTPNSVSYEGFLMGMLLASMLDASNTTNTTTIVNSVYKRNFFFVKETIFGPYNRDDVVADGSLVSFPGFCNVGARSVFMQSIANGTTKLIRDNVTRGESAVASVTATLQTCRIQSTTQVPLRVITPTGSETTAMQQILFAGNKQAALAARFVVADKVPASSNITASVFTAIVKRYKPVVYVGPVGVGASPASAGVLTLQTNNPLLVEDPPLVADANAAMTIRVDPVLADFVMAMANYAASLAGLGGVVAIADTARLAELSVLSLNTYGLVPGAVLSSGTAAVSDAVTGFLARAEGGNATLFVAASTQAMVHDVLAALAAQAGGASGAALSRGVVLLACDPSLLYTEVLAGTTATIPTALAVVFPSHVTSPWLATSPTGTVLNTTLSARLDYNNIRGVMLGAGILQSSLLLRASGGTTSAELMATIFRNGQIAGADVTVGPLYATACSADVIKARLTERTCQCTKGPRRFNVYSLHDVGTSNSESVAFSFSYTGCGPTYVPLPPKPSDNTALILAIAIPVGVALLAMIIIAFCCCAGGGRDNRSAPKDSEEPFAMVFTDIQSSTSLWARAPMQMSESVERHHDEIRKLVRKYDGYEVKTIGDSFMVAFKKSTDAVKFALAIQTTFYHLNWPSEIDQTYQELILEALEEMGPSSFNESKLVTAVPFHDYDKHWNGIRVRVGLHWGVGSVKLDPVSMGYDYYGTLVNTAARVEGVGNGGQVLVTKEMYDELERCNFEFQDLHVTNLGPQPLRGLDNPVVLYQLNPPELAGRQFNALRLDKEVEVQDENSEQSESTTNAGNSVYGANNPLTAEAVIQRVLRAKGAAPQSVVDLMVRFHAFLDTMFSTSPAAFRKDTLKQLAKTWRVTMKRDTSDAARLTNEVNLTCQIANTMGASKKYRHLVGGQHDRRMSAASMMASSMMSAGDPQNLIKPISPLM